MLSTVQFNSKHPTRHVKIYRKVVATGIGVFEFVHVVANVWKDLLEPREEHALGLVNTGAVDSTTLLDGVDSRASTDLVTDCALNRRLGIVSNILRLPFVFGGKEFEVLRLK